MGDVQPDDPIFILRRAVAYRPTNTSRHHRLSAPLDELALSHLHRDSTSSDLSVEDKERNKERGSKPQARQPSRQEIIAAQRAASRANQRAMLSTQANAQRGVDVVLPDKAMLRSQRYNTDSRMRYSYVLPDGETYDISDIVEKEWRGEMSPGHKHSTSGDDLLHGVLGKDGLGSKLERVLSQISLPRARLSTPSGRVPTPRTRLMRRH